MTFVAPKDAPGLKVQGTRDPLAMRGPNSRDLMVRDVIVREDDLMIPCGIFIMTVPHWPHVMARPSHT